MLRRGPTLATELADGGRTQKRPTADVSLMATGARFRGEMGVQQHKAVTPPAPGQELGGGIGFPPWQCAHQGERHGALTCLVGNHLGPSSLAPCRLDHTFGLDKGFRVAAHLTQLRAKPSRLQRRALLVLARAHADGGGLHSSRDHHEAGIGVVDAQPTTDQVATGRYSSALLNILDLTVQEI